MTTAAPSAFDRLFDLGGKVLDSPQQVAQFVEAVKTTADAIKTIATSRVEQERIRANAQSEIANIHAVRDVLLTYLDRSFDERRKNFDALFSMLDRALEAGQLDAVAKTLDSVVALAASSPFKDLADASKAHGVLKDKNRHWEL